jgi:hypothetical protein
VRPGAHQRAVGPEHAHERPRTVTIARQHLEAIVEVGALVRVHPHRHEVSLDRGRHVGLIERLEIEHVAGVRGAGPEHQQDWPAELGGTRECRLAERPPGDRLPVRTGIVGAILPG